MLYIYYIYIYIYIYIHIYNKEMFRFKLQENKCYMLRGKAGNDALKVADKYLCFFEFM